MEENTKLINLLSKEESDFFLERFLLDIRKTVEKVIFQKQEVIKLLQDEINIDLQKGIDKIKEKLLSFSVQQRNEFISKIDLEDWTYSNLEDLDDGTGIDNSLFAFKNEILAIVQSDPLYILEGLVKRIKSKEVSPVIRN